MNDKKNIKIYKLPNKTSCCGMNSCISDNILVISCESFVMLHNSSWLKSGVNCLHKRIWLITLPKLEGPALFSVYYDAIDTRCENTT